MSVSDLNYDIVIIGGGPAGLAAAVAATKEGTDNILILERDNELGGILNQCIHNGFGLHTFKEELTGPEYAHRFIEETKDLQIKYKLNTMVLSINEEKVVTAVNQEDGLITIGAKAIILAMGCRERPRGAINIPGSRCSGILPAGAAQKFVNIDGYMPGKKVVILGSGDIGLIMARRMVLEGAEVEAVVELMPYSGGLKRNIVQCLDDFDIPLLLSHTIIDIKGKDRLSSVTIAKVDEKRKIIPGTEREIECDTLLLSVGLLPENELSRQVGVALSSITGGPIVNESLQTNIEGIFACGNVLHVHDLVDFVTEESYKAGKCAVDYVQGKHYEQTGIELVPDHGVRYIIPQTINAQQLEREIDVRFRVSDVYKKAYIAVYFDNECHQRKKKRILTPGEMESVKITKEILNQYPDCKEIRIVVEEV